MFFEKHLKYIKLNNQFVSFTKLNLSYLLKDIYDVAFVKEVYASPVVSYQELKNGPIVSTGAVRIPYYTKDQYKKTAKYIGLMDDFRVSQFFRYLIFILHQIIYAYILLYYICIYILCAL